MTLKEIKNVIDEYGKLKDEANKTKKVIEKDSKTIKGFLSDSKITSFSGEDFEVYTTTRNESSFDENKLIEVCKAYNLDVFKQAIDEKKLEKIIYNENLPEEVIEKIKECQVFKVTTVLNYRGIGNEQ